MCRIGHPARAMSVRGLSRGRRFGVTSEDREAEAVKYQEEIKTRQLINRLR